MQRENSKISTISFIILFGLIVAVAAAKLGFGPIIGAFIAGVIIHHFNRRKVEFKEYVQELETITFAFIIPFFFINIGLHFDITAIASNVYLVLMVLFVAIVSKLLGALLSKPLTKLTLRQSMLIGWGMNSRGAVELVIAQLALDTNLISVEVYSALVFMAIVTTLLFPIVMKMFLSRDRHILFE